MQVESETYLAHYGILRRSGRYPWGSGENTTQSARNKGFLDYVSDMKKQGLTEKEIAKGISSMGDEGVSIAQLRAAVTNARNEQLLSNIRMAQRLKDKANSNVAIGKRMGVNESVVRTWLAPGAEEKAKSLNNTTDMLKRQVLDKKYVDVGSGVESQLGLSRERLNAALHQLKEEGFVVHPIKIKQATTIHETEYRILAAPGTEWKEVKQNQDKIQQIAVRTLDGGLSYSDIKPPLSLDPKRIQVAYKEDGGATKDGIIYVRPNVADISLGGSSYAQVRIKVGDSHFLKGVALYKEDMPPGVDIIFNSPKSSTGNDLDAMKPLSDDPELPFGAQIKRQVLANEGTDKQKVTSVMNILTEEGGWTRWSKSLAPQFLAKQPPSLAKEQLAITIDARKKEFKEILALSNPTVKKQLLMDFAEGADSSSVNLKAAAMSSDSRYHCILPVDSISPNEVYAPNFENGTRVVLVRFPHGGRFELPQLTVNNKNPEARKSIGQAKDAVGIHHSVAEQMSGADFDGDFVVVIPNNNGKIKVDKPLEALKGFDPMAYKWPTDMPHKLMSAKAKQTEMGKVSNLITDMTVRGAPIDEIGRAIKHSMVVIDAEKKDLNYKASERDNGISQLKSKYQTPFRDNGKAGSSTLMSRAKGEITVAQRKERKAADGGPIDTITGELKWEPTNNTKLVPETKTRKDPVTGKQVKYRTGNLIEEPVTRISTKLAETSNAHTLSSGTRIEEIYANHSNVLKDLANQARLAAVHTPPLKQSASAKTTYASELRSLNDKLALAKENRPRERQAQVIAAASISAKEKSNSDLTYAQKKKIRQQAITVARNRVGAKKKDHLIAITQEEWNAIQAGAVSNSKLKEILDNTDMSIVRQYATPHHALTMTTTKVNTANSMMSLGYTRAEIAKKLGVSLTTLNTALEGG